MISIRKIRFNFWYDVKNFTSSGDVFKGQGFGRRKLKWRPEVRRREREYENSNT